ncbi:unnamed protein product [Bursaphelenchus xylophilus]|uniref:tryptophan--tRNA ligase n=1 Tax=Bursaphelenchus xylophilus TaxID=6326 RepID=A0A1I7SU58_BURXY|nr:unnamed protein product [Bursaphelenchus xylophilus]CAG9107545.1 unnamed protein product [Bursaphelenchus xylophilus]
MASIIKKVSRRASHVIVSGIQPTGSLHIGNYLGFVKNFVKLQDSNTEAEKFLFVADLHSNSVKPKHENFRYQCRKLVASLIACGVNPSDTLLFYQSQVPEHAELAWHLGSVVTINRLSKLPQFREKSNEDLDGVSPNLLTYPVLQAADILLYKCTKIPVGEDQVMHVNLTFHIIEVLKGLFKKQCFPKPELILSRSPRIKSLSDPAKKMSKSDPNQHAAVFLDDSEAQVLKKVKRAMTDSTGEKVRYDRENRPGVCNLLEIVAELEEKTVEDVAQECSGLDSLGLKLRLAELINETFRPIQRRMKEIEEDEQYLDTVLVRNAEIARETAVNTLKEFKEIIGYDQPQVYFNKLQGSG